MDMLLQFKKTLCKKRENKDNEIKNFDVIKEDKKRANFKVDDYMSKVNSGIRHRLLRLFQD